MAEAAERKNGAGKLPDGWEEWPTLTQAANLIGLTRTRLSSYIKTGALKKYQAPNSKNTGVGSYRIDPDDLHRLEEQLEDESAEQATPTTADVVRASVEGQKAATAHAERLISLLEGPYKFVLDGLREENSALRAELKAMREERATLEAQREEARSSRALEELALTELRNEQATKQQALDVAKPLVEHFVKAALLKGGVDPKLIALREAVAGIPRDTYAALFASNFLPPEVVAKLKIGLDWRDDEPAEKETP